MSARPSGLLVVDKPSGPTSHDVVARVRRALGTREVGHAGTLDPMASGVMVVLVGEATKLASFATGEDKRYVARVSFGRSTDTLDALGTVTEERLVALPNTDAIERALDVERARTEQIPPIFSAIQRDGQRSYALARAGRATDLPPRPIVVRTLTELARGAGEDGDLPFVDLDVHVGKGYYVRSLAKDLGMALGVPTHLSSLRRTQSGSFDLASAVALDDAPALARGLWSVERAATQLLPVARLSEAGAQRARQGKRLAASDFETLTPTGIPTAWLGPRGELVAIGRTDEDVSTIVRGFRSDPVEQASG
jgi:tRNA pseudouridine55 synthase